MKTEKACSKTVELEKRHQIDALKMQITYSQNDKPRNKKGGPRGVLEHATDK